MLDLLTIVLQVYVYLLFIISDTYSSLPVCGSTYWKMGDTDNCAKYYECASGTLHHRDCAAGTYWDYNVNIQCSLLQCVPYSSSPPTTSSSSSITMSSSTTTPTSTSTTTTNPTSSQAILQTTATTGVTSTDTTPATFSTLGYSDPGCNTTGNCEYMCVSHQSYTEEELETEIQRIKAELKVNTKELSSYIRARISAGDERQSAAVIGYLGVVVLTTILVIIVLFDLPHIFNCVTKLKRSKRVASM